MLRFESDQGYVQRRPKRSRPLRRYTLDYLGKTTAEMHILRDFVLQHRLGGLLCTFYHPTAVDRVTILSSSPVICQYFHGLFTGQYVFVGASSNTSLSSQIWRVTRIDPNQIALNGSLAGAEGFADVVVYLPVAAVSFASDTWESPTKLIGPEATNSFREGYFSFSLVVEEVF
jgi:hypothetical protein